ncbi:MAG: class I SAM-dependent methyltransferase [bacterium]
MHKDLIEVLIGLDIDLKRLREAKMRGILVVYGDATKLPFKNDSFDAIISFHVIEHIKKDLAFVNEIYRVLKNSGFVIMITPNRVRLNSVIYRLFHRHKEKYPMNPEHVFEYTKKDLGTLFLKSSFKHYEIRPIGLVRLPRLEITTVPRFLSKYCDQLMAILKK